MNASRLPNAAHETHSWRIHEIASDFTLLDVWALPAHGGPDDFPKLLEVMASLDTDGTGPLPVRAVWRVRRRLGSMFGWDDTDELPIPGKLEASLAARLPDDLTATVADLPIGNLPFEPLYLTENESAAEISNKTVHGVMHLGWVDQGNGRFQGQMAVLVKPRGRMGSAYMSFISPFRHWLVYPALMQQIEHTWDAKAGS